MFPIGNFLYKLLLVGVSIGAYYNWWDINWLPLQSELWLVIGYYKDYLPWLVYKALLTDFI